MKKILSIVLSTALVMSLAACGSSNVQETTTTTVAASETDIVDPVVESADDGSGNEALTVGFDQDFPPMGFVGDDGQFTGFDIELAQEAAKRMGVKCVLQPIAWDSKDMELTTGTIDCIWNGFTIQGREDAYEWTKPYMDNTQVFVVRTDSGITGSDGLAGKVVEVQVDSSAEAALKENTELASTFGTLQTTPDYNTAFMDLESGAVDAIAMDVIVAGYQLQQRDDGSTFTILDDTIASEQYGVGFALGNTDLRDKVQTALDEMAADGTMKTISEKWFGEDVTLHD